MYGNRNVRLFTYHTVSAAPSTPSAVNALVHFPHEWPMLPASFMLFWRYVGKQDSCASSLGFSNLLVVCIASLKISANISTKTPRNGRVDLLYGIGQQLQKRIRSIAFPNLEVL